MAIPWLCKISGYPNDSIYKYLKEPVQTIKNSSGNRFLVQDDFFRHRFIKCLGDSTRNTVNCIAVASIDIAFRTASQNN